MLSEQMRRQLEEVARRARALQQTSTDDVKDLRAEFEALEEQKREIRQRYRRISFMPEKVSA